jgi:phage-related protein
LLRQKRAISWLKAARKDFDGFPEEARRVCAAALVLAAEGDMADIAKPMKGMGSGVFEIALKFRGDAFRVIYCVLLGADLWVIHAFKKKSKTGIKTPKQDIDLIKQRLKQVREI